MRLVSLVVGLILAALISANAVRAAEIADLGEVRSYAVSGPRLAGDQVLWAAGRPDEQWSVFAARPGLAPVTLVTSPTPSPPGHEGVGHLMELAASSAALAYRDLGYAVDSGKYGSFSPLFDTLAAGPIDGPWTLRAECPTLYPSNIWPVAVDDTRMASVAPCGDRTTIRIDDLSGRTAPRMIPTTTDRDWPRPDGIELAGPFLAWATPESTPRITVVDLRTLERRVAWTGENRSSIGGWDLRDDGAVAVAAGPSEIKAVHRLEWVDAAGTVRVLADTVDPGRIRFVGDRIAVVLGTERSTAQDAPPLGRTALSLVSLDGTIQTIAVFGPSFRDTGWYLSGATSARDLDFDGARLAWVQWRCGAAAIHVVRVDEVVVPTTAETVIPCSQPRIATKQITIRPDGAVRVAVRCPRACRGRLDLYVVHRQVARHTFRLPGSPEARTVTMRVTRSWRRRVPRASRATLTLEADDTLAHNWADRRQVRRVDRDRVRPAARP